VGGIEIELDGIGLGLAAGGLVIDGLGPGLALGG